MFESCPVTSSVPPPPGQAAVDDRQAIGRKGVSRREIERPAARHYCHRNRRAKIKGEICNPRHLTAEPNHSAACAKPPPNRFTAGDRGSTPQHQGLPTVDHHLAATLTVIADVHRGAVECAVAGNIDGAVVGAPRRWSIEAWSSVSVRARIDLHGAVGVVDCGALIEQQLAAHIDRPGIGHRSRCRARCPCRWR